MSIKTIVVRILITVIVSLLLLLISMLTVYWTDTTRIRFDIYKGFYEAPYSTSFMEGLRVMSPANIRDCVESKVLKEWPTMQAFEADMPKWVFETARGEGDIVKIAIHSAKRQCELEKLNQSK